MSNIKRVFRITPSVRFRVLAIALIPSSSLLIVGGGTAGYFLQQANSIQTWSTAINHTAGPAMDFVEAVQNERRTSMLILAGDQSVAGDLPAERARLNASIPTMMAAGNDLIKLFHGSVGDAVVQMQATFGQLPLIRQRVDLGAAQIDEVYGYYNKVIQTVIVAGRLAARTAKVPEAANEQDTEIGLFETAEAMSRSSSLAAAGAFHGGFTPSQQEEYSKLVGFYRYELDNRIGELTPGEMATYQALVSSPAWMQMGAIESGLIRRSAELDASAPSTESGGPSSGAGGPGSSSSSGPGGSSSGAAGPGGTSSGAGGTSSGPGGSSSGTAGPGGSGTARPGGSASGPGAAPSGAAGPNAAGPGTSQPGVTSPGTSQPGVSAAPGPSSPKTSSPRTSPPGALSQSGPGASSGTGQTGTGNSSSGTSSNSATGDTTTTETGDTPPMPPAAEWQDAADQVGSTLRGMWNSHLRYAGEVADKQGSTLSRQSVEGGAAALALSLVAFVAAAYLSQRLIGRLRRLRAETLQVSETRLPRIMDQLGRSESVDLDKELPKLDFGRDEIGQVADAFNRAQTAAVAAAINEAHTRQGVRAVFVNIAHRSQVTMHQLLGQLERAEHRHDDPDTLKMLFEFDNLATRERRNAENLVILGGEQPGRQWRNPVPLHELVRSAVTETEHYPRVHIVRLPEVRIIGSAVADLIHLLAELIDNAATFSPPRTRVEISGDLGGSAVIVAISDLGVGLTRGEMARFNEALTNPPDFNIEALSTDPRLGLFVVAQLAKRHEVAVRLTESDFGGIRSVVRIPYNLVSDEAVDDESLPPSELGEGAEDNLGELRRWSHRLGGQQPGLPAAEEPAEPAPVPLVPEPEPVGAMASYADQAPPESWGEEPIGAGAEAQAYDGPPLPQRRRQTQVIPRPPAPDVHPSVGRQRDRPTGQGRPTDLWTSLQAGTKLGRAGVPAGSRLEVATEGEGQWND